MAYEKKPGRGALFINDKGDNDARPDRRGDLVCPCCKAELKLSGWIEKAKSGQSYLSVKAEQASAGEAPKKAEPAQFNDDIPF